MFSIILNAYDTDKAQRHMTIACIGEIVRFTDQPYELIVVDNLPQWQIRDDYKVFPDYKLIETNKLETVYESYNIGAREAKYDILMFIQNDVFVHERTLNKLAKYMEAYDVAYPQQIELSREDTKKVLATSDGEEAHIGGRDAGLIAMRKSIYDAIGGWDGRFRNLLGEKALYQKIEDAGGHWTDKTNAFISHIKAGNNLKKDPDLYKEEMGHDVKLGKEEYGWL